MTHPGSFWSFFHPSEPTPTAGFLENPTNPFSDSVFGSGFVELGGVILLKAWGTSQVPRVDQLPFFLGGGGWDGHPNFPASIGNPYNQCINPHSDWMDDRGHMSINDSCEKTSKSLTIWPQQQPAASLSIVPRPAAGTRGSSASLCDSSNEPSWYHIRTTWGLQMRKFWKNDSCQAVQRGNVATWQPWT